MKRFAAFSLAAALLASTAACSGIKSADTATNTRKAGYDAIAAYNAVAPLARTYMQQPYASSAIKAKIKADSAVALPLITTLGADLQTANPVSAIEVSAALKAVAALQTDITKGKAQ